MAKTFEIGLTMAGAISAGAYTASVMDFFIEALDAYYAAKKQPGWDGPTHDVRIPIMAGASAGGMTSAICALHAFRDSFDHVWPKDPARKSPQRRRHFNLPENAELFADFTGDREKWFIRKANGGDFKTLAAGGETGLRALPIIPLIEALQQEIVIGAEDLPTPQALFQPKGRDELRGLIHSRAKKVVGRLVDVDLPFGDSVIGWAERWGAKRVGTGFAFKKARTSSIAPSTM